MTTLRLFKVLSLGAALLAVTASAAQAQPKAEIGASLVSSVIGLGEDSGATLGIPSGAFGLVNPGVYASFFLGTRFAVEPQVGFVWADFGGDSAYLLNFAGQFNYFLRGTSRPSPYIFGAAGLVSQTDADYTPKSLGGGAGYRMPIGDRLSFRFDGRYTHMTGESEGGDMLAFSFSIGGIFGR